MAYVLAVLLFLLKALGWILLAALALIILSAALPAKARVRGSLAASELLRTFFDEDADSEYVEVDAEYAVEGSILGGTLGVSMTSDDGLRVSFLGMKFHPKKKARKPDAGDREGGREKGAKPVRTPHHGDRQHMGAESTETGGKTARRKTSIKVSVGQIKRFLSPAIRKKTGRTLKALFLATYFSGSLDIVAGFPDPAITGMAVAAYWSMGGPSRLGGITFQPVFQSEMFSVKGSGEVRVTPGQVGWIAGRYLLSKEIRQLWRKPKERQLNKEEPKEQESDSDKSVGAACTD